MNLTPVSRSWSAPPDGGPVDGGTGSESTTKHMIMKPAVATKNTAAVPAVDMISPATAGAPMRVPCQIAAFSATALAIAGRSIRCGKSACRAGSSNAPNAPVMNAAAIRCHASMRPETVSAPSAPMTSVITIWLSRISRRLSTRSATTPPTRFRTMAGIAAATPT